MLRYGEHDGDRVCQYHITVIYMFYTGSIKKDFSKGKSTEIKVLKLLFVEGKKHW